MEVGREFQCTVEKVALGGDGMCRVDGEVVFIPGVLPGEKLIGRITAERRGFSRAEVVRFGEQSPARIAPPCPHFKQCGACKYLHVDYETENRLKSGQLDDVLRSGGIELSGATVRPVYAPEPDLGYRNKIVLHFHRIGKLQFFGYVKPDNSTVCDIGSCPLAHHEINRCLEQCRGENGFFHSLHEGMRVTFRRTEYDGVKFWRNNPAANLTWLREKTPFGELSVPCGGFFQVNPAGGAHLAERFMALVRAEKTPRVVDLYCGAGFFGCAAAAAGVDRVVGVESDPDSAAAAGYNLKKFGIDAEVRAGDAARVAAETIAQAGSDTLLAVDPPRTGLHPALIAQLNAGKIKTLSYISCDPATWSRDAARLQKGGFRLAEVELVNMFPRTAHFELFSVWRR